jgi:hypothetical protein
MKKFLSVIVLIGFLAAGAGAVLTFYLVDNFEDGTYAKWFSFDNVKLSIFKNPKSDKRDLVLESAGENALSIVGSTKDWYVGGAGTNLSVDASNYSRLQLDIFGTDKGGKIKIELYKDANNSGTIEQDEANQWKPTQDDIFGVEVPILKGGYTRYSIPFTAFVDSNPGVGKDKWEGAGAILRLQLIFIAASQEGTVDCAVDNVIFTY